MISAPSEDSSDRLVESLLHPGAILRRRVRDDAIFILETSPPCRCHHIRHRLIIEVESQGRGGDHLLQQGCVEHRTGTRAGDQDSRPEPRP